MTTYLIRRLLLMIPTLIGITFLVFMIVAMAPGGIGAALKAQGGTMQSQASVAVQQAYLDDRYGLDDPAIVQYGRWLARIFPVKVGERAQVSRGGDLVRPPKPLKDPPVWQWFIPSLPQEPAGVSAVTAADRAEKRQEALRAAERRWADARGEYLKFSTMLKEELGTYATAAGIRRGVDAKGQGRVGVLAGHTPNRSADQWPAVEVLWGETIKAYTEAQQARANLTAVFRTRPFPEAGVAIIPGTLSLAAPDMGVTFSGSRPVLGEIGRALPVTLMLNLIAFPIIYSIAIPGGMLAATKRGSVLDVGMGMLFIALWSVPTVLAGVLAIGFLASNEYLGAFPVSGLHSNNAGSMPFLPRSGEAGFERGFLLDALWHICLPVACLVYTGFAILSKQTRAAMLENFNADYVRTAKAKGVEGRDIVLRHVFRNSLLPLITLFVTIFPAMLAGSVVIEKIFTLPGMGRLIFDSIAYRDRELLLANTMMIAAVNLLALLLADILYALADPRVAYE